MNRPLTDRERILQLEADLGEAREELAAWRAWDGDGRQRLGVEEGREQRIVQRLRRDAPMPQGLPGVARLLIFFMDHPDRILCRDRLAEVVVLGDHEGPAKIVDVRLAGARHVLGALGLDRLMIVNMWGRGWAITAANAAILKAALEGDA